MKAILTIVCGFFALLAGIFWWVSAISSVKNNSEYDTFSIGESGFNFVTGGIDMVATAKLQAKWNKRVAIAASISAFSQFALLWFQ